MRTLTIVGKNGESQHWPLGELAQVVLEFAETEAGGKVSINPDAYGATILIQGRDQKDRLPLLGVDLFDGENPSVHFLQEDNETPILIRDRKGTCAGLPRG